MKAKGLIVAAVLISSATGASVTLTMDEVPNTVLNGLVVTKGGVGFTFTAPNLNLHYNVVTGADPETYVQEPVIGGTNGTITVAFSVPVSNIQFGLQVSSSNPVATMASVALFNNGVPVGTFPLGSTLTDPFAEGQFTYSGPGPVTSMVITPTGTGFTALSLDNLAIVTSPVTTATVPAVSPLALAVTAILLVGLTMFLLQRQAA